MRRGTRSVHVATEMGVADSDRHKDFCKKRSV